MLSIMKRSYGGKSFMAAGVCSWDASPPHILETGSRVDRKGGSAMKPQDTPPMPLSTTQAPPPKGSTAILARGPGFQTCEPKGDFSHSGHKSPKFSNWYIFTCRPSGNRETKKEEGQVKKEAETGASISQETLRIVRREASLNQNHQEVLSHTYKTGLKQENRTTPQMIIWGWGSSVGKSTCCKSKGTRAQILNTPQKAIETVCACHPCTEGWRWGNPQELASVSEMISFCLVNCSVSNNNSNNDYVEAVRHIMSSFGLCMCVQEYAYYHTHMHKYCRILL